MATNGSSTADVIINVYVDAQSLDQNALTVDITSVIIPSISDDDKVESDMAATLTKDLQKLAQRSLDYPQIEHLLGRYDTTIRPTATGIAVSYRQARLNKDPIAYYSRSLITDDLMASILQCVFRTDQSLRGATFEVTCNYSRRLKLEQQLYNALANKQRRYEHMIVCVVISAATAVMLIALAVSTGHMLDNPDPVINVAEWIILVVMLASGFYGMVCNTRIQQYRQQLRHLLQHLHTAD